MSRLSITKSWQVYQRHLEVGDKVNLNEDQGPHEDLNEHDVSEEASVFDEDQH